jgi:hypothetical protein
MEVLDRESSGLKRSKTTRNRCEELTKKKCFHQPWHTTAICNLNKLRLSQTMDSARPADMSKCQRLCRLCFLALGLFEEAQYFFFIPTYRGQGVTICCKAYSLKKFKSWNHCLKLRHRIHSELLGNPWRVDKCLHGTEPVDIHVVEKLPQFLEREVSVP